MAIDILEIEAYPFAPIAKTCSYIEVITTRGVRRLEGFDPGDGDPDLSHDYYRSPDGAYVFFTSLRRGDVVVREKHFTSGLRVETWVLPANIAALDPLKLDDMPHTTVQNFG
jgi:hypothetical protein